MKSEQKSKHQLPDCFSKYFRKLKPNDASKKQKVFSNADYYVSVDVIFQDDDLWVETFFEHKNVKKSIKNAAVEVVPFTEPIRTFDLKNDTVFIFINEKYRTYCLCREILSNIVKRPTV